jgi:poly(3-hydroxyoctanoate) depolymerase
MEERYIAFHGLKLFVREQGDGRPLVLVNGLGGNVQMWAVAQRRLSRIARTVAFDAPGAGRSRLSPVPLPVPIMARMVGRLLDELGHAQVDMMGYSLGGALAQQFAHTAPDRVRRLALIGTSCGWGSAPPELLPLALITSPLRYTSKRFYKATSHLIDGGDHFRDADLRDAQADARKSSPPNPLGYANQIMQGTKWSSLHWLRTVQVPTLVIAGGCDRLVPPANGLLLAHKLPNSRLHMLADEGHLMLFDPDSAALPLLEDFFSSPELDDSSAWTTGADVDDDLRVATALRLARGVQPVKALSAVYRGAVQSSLARRVFA